MDHKASRGQGSAEDISSLAAYLTSSHLGFITGANFVVDGGMIWNVISA
jgi:NAD(P)-dependent dehydrogenase (short-subunit alcohol dehydrogenase family)